MFLRFSELLFLFLIFFFKQKTAYEMRISDWSSDVCSSDLPALQFLIAGMKGSQIVADDPDDTAGLSEVLRGLRDHGAFARAGLASQDDGGGRLDRKSVV